MSSNDEQISKRRLAAIADRTAKDLGPMICDRRFKLLVYKQCVPASDVLRCVARQTSRPQGPREDDPSETERRAVDAANSLIDAGFLSHVKNEHRFHVGEKRLLYFRFDLEAVGRALRGRDEENGTAKNAPETTAAETAKMKAKIRRMADEAASTARLLNEAHGRLALLETSHRSLCVLSCTLNLVTIAFFAVSCFGRTRTVCFMTFLAILMGRLFLPSSDDGVFARVHSLYRSLIGHVESLFVLSRCKAIEEFDSITSGSDYSPESAPGTETVERRASLFSMSPVKFAKDSSEAKGTSQSDGTIRMREWNSIPPPERWHHFPLFVCSNLTAANKQTVRVHGTGAVPLGTPFYFESELFVGTMLLRIRNVNSDNLEGDKRYFKGRRRCFQSIVQGRFKEKLLLSDVLTGHEFARSLKKLPASWIVNTGTSFIRRLAPGAVFDITSKQPKSMAILAATAQAVSIDMPGSEPDIECNQVDEDCALLGGVFNVDPAISVPQRKKYLSRPDRAKNFCYDTESIYTFDFYQNLLDLSTYSLDLGFKNFGLLKHLDGQPAQVLAKCSDGRYLWSFQIWHEKMVPR